MLKPIFYGLVVEDIWMKLPRTVIRMLTYYIDEFVESESCSYLNQCAPKVFALSAIDYKSIALFDVIYVLLPEVISVVWTVRRSHFYVLQPART